MPVAVSLSHTLVTCPLCPLFTVENSMVTKTYRASCGFQTAGSGLALDYDISLVDEGPQFRRKTQLNGSKITQCLTHI